MRRSLKSPNSGAGGMHLFDFNETLAARRLLEDKRIAMEMEMERLYRSRSRSADPFVAAVATRPEDAEAIRRLLNPSGRRALVVPKETTTAERQKAPNVVARLMGLDAFPSEQSGQKQQQLTKKKSERSPHKSVADHQTRKQKQWSDLSAAPRGEVPREVQRHEDRHIRREPETVELEEMKRQLSMKQVLVREKLNEAKRLLSHEKLTDSKWYPAQEKLNQSKKLMDAVDLFQTNRDAFLGYVDERDTILHQHLESLPNQRMVERIPPEGLRNPIVRRVIEERRNDEFRLFLNRQANKEQPPNNHDHGSPVPTRIVVLKPGPSRHGQRAASPSPRTPAEAREFVNLEMPQAAANKLPDSKDEAGANPREIAKEIARQVRENVVRELARNGPVTEEYGAEKRITTVSTPEECSRLAAAGTDYVNAVPNLEDDYPRRTTRDASGQPRTGARTSGRNGKPRTRLQPDMVDDYAVRLSLPKRTSNRMTGGQGQVPLQAAKPVSKGIVVLVPDQAVRSRTSAKASAVKENRGRIHQQQALVGRRRLETPKKQAEAEPDYRTEESTASCNDGLLMADAYAADIDAGEQESPSLKFQEEVVTTVESGYIFECGSEEPLKTKTRSETAASLSESEETKAEEAQAAETDWTEAVASPPVSQDNGLAAVEQSRSGETDWTEAAPSPSVASNNSLQQLDVTTNQTDCEADAENLNFETISSELEQLRSQLRLLRWNAGEDQAALDTEPDDTASVVDKAVVENDAEPPRLITSPSEAAEQGASETSLETAESCKSPGLEWLEWESFQIDGIPCPDNRKEDQEYVKKVLLAAGYLGRDAAFRDVAEEEDEEGPSFGSHLFYKLEGYYCARAKAEGEKEASMRPWRRLLFEVVKEVVSERLHRRRPWLPSSTASLPLDGKLLLCEVWSRVSEFYDFPGGEDLQHTVENLIERYLNSGDRWMDRRTQVEQIGKQVEAAIFSELLSETIYC